MLDLQFASRDENSPYRILCLGAHCDDIEIGCGGTILKLLKAYSNVEVYWTVFSSSAVRKKEAASSASVFLSRAKIKTIVIKNFRDGFFPYSGTDIKEQFENLKRTFKPDIIFTHYRHDLHQDHRLICDLTWNTWRNHLILEYEIPKFDGDLGQPNFFVPLSHTEAEQKAHHIFDEFVSQRQKRWFTPDTFIALMRLRGIESISSEEFAEAFYCRKISLGLSTPKIGQTQR